ncbi:MAG: nucleotide exchange factor GrpE [Pseudomonadota bacterium]
MSDKNKAEETPQTDEEAEAPAADAATFDFDLSGEDEGVEELMGADETITALIQQIADVTAERDELKDKLMRALAEAENTRRRAERDRKDAEAFGGTKLARDLLEVHDNFGRALASADDAAKEHAASLIEGVELTQKGLLAAFAKHKIEMVSPEPGEKFDPNLHQAMFEAPIPGAEPGSIIEVMQAGFTIAGRLLRPALVGVAKAANG